MKYARSFAAAWIAIALIGFMAAGCDHVKAPPAGPGDLLPAEAYPQIVASEGTSLALRFSRPIVDPSTPERPMHVTVPVRSIEDDYPLNVQYQFQFLDGQGRPLGNSNSWRFMNLRPREQHFLEGRALDPAAADWRLIVRSAR